MPPAMMAKRSSDRPLQIRGPAPPIRLGSQVAGTRSRLDTLRVVLARGIAVVWLFEGAQHWLGVLTGAAISYLPAASPLHIAGLFFFCILDFVAAIGLWLVTRWGLAVWGATLLGHGLALVLAPGFFADPVLLLGVDSVLLAGYAALAWASSRRDDA
ncbi:hypothetical protein P7D22_06245 [Lichenihabitans sp. Uapishka_5]|uniref:hypothetical protein n=1 Tax=Lichenihabitans sp. Uapishka_5 TaxID=3037302 RepID=UPI0029E82541|nr:hypothetical protein [Lichenihabitans sp. Uapishka_5]MDX7950778.1 hypothetical protein [Lichenihabitans sp. Uapishka_5]